MDDVSALLLRLADPATRGDLLDADGLLAIATVGYGVDPATVVGATTAVYDRFDVAVPVLPEVVAAARMSRAGEPVPWEVTASWDGLVAPSPGADAVWAGSVVLRTAGGSGLVESVDVGQPDLDAAFAAALAGLPATATPDEVRAALRHAAASGLGSPPLTDTELDALLHAVDPAAVDPRTLGRAAGRELVALRLAMSAPADPASVPPVTLPVVVAFLVAGAAATPRDLLQATAAARRAARAYPVRPALRGGPQRRADRCVCWVLPGSVFDDDGWPGAAGGDAAARRAARLTSARSWLADNGIAVVTT